MQAQGLKQAGGALPGETRFLFRTNGLKSLIRAYDEVLALPARNSGLVFSVTMRKNQAALILYKCLMLQAVGKFLMTVSCGDLCVCLCVCVYLYSTLSLYLSTAGNILIDIETEQDTVPPHPTMYSVCLLSMENFSQRICLISFILKGYRWYSEPSPLSLSVGTETPSRWKRLTTWWPDCSHGISRHNSESWRQRNGSTSILELELKTSTLDQITAGPISRWLAELTVPFLH